MTLPQKNGNRIKTPSSKLTILVSSCWEKNFIRNNAHNFFILSLVFFKLLIVSVAFFLGHPVYIIYIDCSLTHENSASRNMWLCLTNEYHTKFTSYIFAWRTWEAQNNMDLLNNFTDSLLHTCISNCGLNDSFVS